MTLVALRSRKRKAILILGGTVGCLAVLLLVHWIDPIDDVDVERPVALSKTTHPELPTAAPGPKPTVSASSVIAPVRGPAPGSDSFRVRPALPDLGDAAVTGGEGPAQPMRLGEAPTVLERPGRPATGRSGIAQDGGIPPIVESRGLAAVHRRGDRARDAGVVARTAGVPGEEWQSEPTVADGQTATARRDGAGRHARGDDASRTRVVRFLDSGGAVLVGRIVDVDTGRPLPGVPVEARLERRFVEIESGADGTFRMPGMVPGSKVVVWIGDRRERVVAERFDVRIPSGGTEAQLGLVSLLAGNEQDPHLDGWIGIYVASRDGRTRVSALNAWVPAANAGIEVGDAVLAVDGRDVAGVGPRGVAFLLRGPVRKPVTLDLESRSGGRRRVTIERLLR